MSKQEVWKTFWGHLEDLRRTFIRIGWVIGLGFIFALTGHENLFQTLTKQGNFSNQPLIKQTIQHERVVNRGFEYFIYSFPPDAQIRQREGIEWISPLQVRLAPQQAVDYEVIREQQLLILSPLEGLLLTMKVCFWISLALTSPLWGWILLQFILPGLKQAEKAVVIVFGCWSCLWMGAGVALAYFVTIPIANQYLQTFNAALGQNAWTLAAYIEYTLLLFLGHILAFELGFLLLCLVHFQCISAEWLVDKRRYMIVAAFILGALLTPPDILTQLMLALPLIGLYEIAILYGRWQVHRRSKSVILP